MTWSLALALFATGFLRAGDAEPKKEKRQYLILPVSTQLQKSVLFSPQHRYYVLINGSAIVTKDGKILSEHLDVGEMWKDIKKGGLSLSPGDTISFRTLYQRDPPDHARSLLEVAMKGWASRDCGFAKPGYDSVIEGKDKWSSLMEWTKEQVGYIAEDEQEDGVGDGRIDVFPVKTLLSRYYLDDANCLVEFARPFDKDFNGKLDEDTKKSIAASVKKLDLAKKKKVTFSIRLQIGAGKAADRFCESAAKELAKELGFASHSVRSGIAR
jgi:hypothetical protein